MTHPSMSNFGALALTKISVAAKATAAGTGDNTETDGASVDRQQSGAAGSTVGNSMAQSAKFVLFGQAVLQDTKTAVFKPTIQHSTTTTAGDFADVADALQPGGAAATTRLTLTGSTGGTTETGAYEWNFDCTSLNRYLRAQVLIDLNASGTDTGFYCAGFILGGFGITPVS